MNRYIATVQEVGNLVGCAFDFFGKAMRRHFFNRSIWSIRFWVFALASTTGFTSFIRAASREEERSPVKIFFADNISAAHRQVIARFNAIHRGRIEVVPVDLPFTKFSTNER